MRSITRRTAIKTTAAAVAATTTVAAIAAIPPTKVEDPIVALWQQVLALREESERVEHLAWEATKRGDKAEYDRLESLGDKIDDNWLAIEERIMDAEPRTAEGWATQAEILVEDMGNGHRYDGRDAQLAKRIAAHLKGMADAERLAGRAES